MVKKTLKELQEKAKAEAKKTQKFQARRALKTQISISKRARRQAKFGTTIKGAKAVGRATVGLSAAAVTLAGQAARRARASQRKAAPKKKTSKKGKRPRNVLEDVYRGNF